MEVLVFILFLGSILAAVIWWGAKTLPGEKWQFMAVVPTLPTAQGEWQALNLTYYGALSATAYTFAVVMFVVLACAAGVPPMGAALFTVLMLTICMPASRMMAQLVEKKRNTLTVGGAVFVGILVAPLLTGLVNLILKGFTGSTPAAPLHVTVLLSAISIAHAFGEGLGRLACLSFGCCYGKPLAQCSPRMQTLAGPFCLVFHGKTKKIAYASGLDGQRVLPVQVVTAVLYNGAGLTGTALFLWGHFGAALVICLMVTQVWRMVSEFFRADFRGAFTITPYQIMAAVTLLVALGTAFLAPPPASALPRLFTGLDTLWSPGALLALELVWGITFLFTGCSSVSHARISFHVQEDRI